MRNPAAQGNTDANHSDVTGWYEALYCRVFDTHKLGGGFGDLVVKIPTKRGAVLSIVEVKTADGKLRSNQERFLAEWGASVVEVVCTREDVFAHVQRVQGR